MPADTLQICQSLNVHLQGKLRGISARLPENFTCRLRSIPWRTSTYVQRHEQSAKKGHFLVGMKPGGNNTLECGGVPVNDSWFSRVLKREEARAENERQQEEER